MINYARNAFKTAWNLLMLLAVHSQETKKELKSLCRLETQILFIGKNLIRLVFNMIWLMANQKI